MPDEPQLRAAWNNLTFPIPLKSDPPVPRCCEGLQRVGGRRSSLGRTPIEQASVPRGIPNQDGRDGYLTYDGTAECLCDNAVLAPIGSVPEGMVRVPMGTPVVEGLRSRSQPFS
jgi:hypothetical protein